MKRISVRADAATPASLGALVNELSAELESAGVPTPRDEARDIVAAVLDLPRFWPTANRDALVDATAVDEARRAAAARSRGAPFAYAVGRAAFRYLTLAVDERVLIPRQETEIPNPPRGVIYGPADWQPIPGPKRSDYKNSMQFCHAERTFLGEVEFRTKHGTKSGANAFGRCVAQQR